MLTAMQSGLDPEVQMARRKEVQLETSKPMRTELRREGEEAVADGCRQ